MTVYELLMVYQGRAYTANDESRDWSVQVRLLGRGLGSMEIDGVFVTGLIEFDLMEAGIDFAKGLRVDEFYFDNRTLTGPALIINAIEIEEVKA